MSDVKPPTYDAYRTLFRGRSMPFAFVDLDLLDTNAAALVQRAGSKPIRVASKSVRCVAVLQRIFGLSSAFRGIMCYSAPEAVHLCAHGFDDLLVAYPTWHKPHIAAVCEQVRAGKTVILMLDSVEHVRHLEAIAAKHGVVLPICLDIDLSLDVPGLHFGTWRSPVTSAEAALTVYAAIEAALHLRLDGVMGYEGHIAGVGDKGAGVEPRMIRLLKRRSIPHLRERRKAIVDALISRGAQLRIVNGGGTGSLESTSGEDCVTEVTAGSGFYSPALFDAYTAFRHQPAAGFAIEIVRSPKPGIYTCFGGGYVASGAAGASKLPQPYLPIGAKLTSREAAGEVQTPVLYTGPETLAFGDPIFMRHAKAGELLEHFNTVSLVSGGRIVDEAPTYRGEGCVFA